ncbi:MAG TPA: HEAT repeat domain-containing protein [Ilumatobacter sp.]|nr:HEAT repeat domain-containing protein [Ilumatobacter sp.]
MLDDPAAAERRRAVIVAGHSGDTEVPRARLTDSVADVRAAAIGALDRCASLTHDELTAAIADPDAVVRRRAAELSVHRPTISLRALLHDDDPTVVEVAAWAVGEQGEIEPPPDDVLTRLIELATGAEAPLVREAAVAALGAVGDDRGLPAILAGCSDKPQIRRRAVLALAPFDGDDVEAAIERALTDRDWQVRQAAEDLRRATGELTVDDADGIDPDGVDPD